MDPNTLNALYTGSAAVNAGAGALVDVWNLVMGIVSLIPGL